VRRFLTCLTLAWLAILLTHSPAASADWSIKGGGVTIDCNVRNVVTGVFGVWASFAASFTCGDPHGDTRFFCSRVGLSSAYECLPMDSYTLNCGDYWVTMNSHNVTINLPAGTQNAQHKICGDLFPTIDVSVRQK
jgi:hypothetical protein